MTINEALFPRIAPVTYSGDRPFWSVVITVYNRTDFLQHCLASVLAQDPGPDQMQIVVVDDCSSVAIAAIVEQVGNGRVEYRRNPRNLGLTNTFNAAVEAAIGQWVHLLHDDDWVLPGFYETLQRSLAEQPVSVGAACCRWANTDEVGNRVFVPDVVRPTAGVLENWLTIVGISNPLQPPAVVIRRSVYEHLGGYHPGVSYTPDWELYKRVATFYFWWYEPQILACFRLHANKASEQLRQTVQQTKDVQRAIALTEAYLPEPLRTQLNTVSRRHYAIVFLGTALDFLRAGQRAIALQYIQDGLQLSREQDVLKVLFAQLCVEADAGALREYIADELVKLPVSIAET